MSDTPHRLALEMLTAISDVLESNDIPSKYYVEYLGALCEAQAASILEQEEIWASLVKD